MTFQGQRSSSSCCLRGDVCPTGCHVTPCVTVSPCACLSAGSNPPEKLTRNLGLSTFTNSSAHYITRISALTLELVSSESPAGRS